MNSEYEKYLQWYPLLSNCSENLITIIVISILDSSTWFPLYPAGFRTAFLEGNSNHIIELDNNPTDSHLSASEMNKSHILSFSGSGHNHPSPLNALSVFIQSLNQNKQWTSSPLATMSELSWSFQSSPWLFLLSSLHPAFFIYFHHSHDLY